MNAAIYARKSTEQTGVATEAKSVARQVELARAFALGRGWHVADEHVYVDDGISGAEFKKRAGLSRLLALLPHPPFSVLVVSEQKSLGRESFETNYMIKQLAEAGVEIVEYANGRSLTPTNWIEKVTSAVLSSVDEGHREQTRERVHEAHRVKAMRGHVVGGRVFGYRNQDVCVGVDVHGRPLRSHVERVICEVEAEVVRRIFALYDSGVGLKAIAKQLTAQGAPAPTQTRRSDGLSPIVGWSPSTVRGILGRELYRGVVVWNKSRKRDDWGKVRQRARPASEWLRTPAPQLQIVDTALWNRVAARRAEVEGNTLRFASGRICGRPPMHATKNLLAGIATCGVCEGGLVVETGTRKGGPRYAHYECNRRRRMGGCGNTLRVAVDEMNEAVLQAIEAHALTPEAIEQVIRLTERDDQREREATLQKERKAVDKRIERLVIAVADGGNVPSLVAKLKELEEQQRAIDHSIAALRPVPRLAPAVVQGRLDEWRRLLRQSTTQARAVLQRILAGRIVFTPNAEGTGYTFKADTRFDKLFTGMAVPCPTYIANDVRGTTHIGPSDTWDADYGRLLERAYANGKGVASPPRHARLYFEGPLAA